MYLVLVILLVASCAAASVVPSVSQVSALQLTLEQVIGSGSDRCNTRAFVAGCCRQGGGRQAEQLLGDFVGGAVRLAFHDTGSFKVGDKAGVSNSNGCLSTFSGDNAGLQPVVDALSPHYPGSMVMSRADFWQYTANVSGRTRAESGVCTMYVSAHGICSAHRHRQYT